MQQKHNPIRNRKTGKLHRVSAACVYSRPVAGLRWRRAALRSAGRRYRSARPLSISPGTLDHVYWINEICIQMSTALICMRKSDFAIIYPIIVRDVGQFRDLSIARSKQILIDYSNAMPTYDLFVLSYGFIPNYLYSVVSQIIGTSMPRGKPP